MPSPGVAAWWRSGAVLGFAGLFRLVASVDTRTYTFLAVSGGLQDGFPARHWLDYHSGEVDENKALLVGHALVRGYKAFLDVKQQGWREHVKEPGQPLVNPVVVPSGCAEHANIYAVFAVDSRQVINALLMEPRFLSMTPDTGLVDLNADETDEPVRELARKQAELEGKKDLDNAAFLAVTGVWSPGSLIESPVLYTKEDGTQVTDYPRSLAAWAGTADATRLDDDPAARASYWAAIQAAARQAEHLINANSETHDDSIAASGPGNALPDPPASSVAARPPNACRSQARYGSGPDTVRMGRAYTKSELLSTLPGVFSSVSGGGEEEKEKQEL